MARFKLNEFEDEYQDPMVPSILRQTRGAVPRSSTMQAPPLQAPAPTMPSARTAQPRGQAPIATAPSLGLQPRAPAAPQPVAGIPGNERRAYDPTTGPPIGPTATPAAQPYGGQQASPGGFQPSGNPLKDIQTFYDNSPNNEGFLEMMEALKAAYPGRVSDVGASAKGVWDKIVIDGQVYDAIEAAGGPNARWMTPLAEGPGGGAGVGMLGGGIGGMAGLGGGVPQPVEQGAGTQAPDKNRTAELVAAMMGNTLPPQYQWMQDLMQQQQQPQTAAPKMAREDPLRFLR